MKRRVPYKSEAFRAASLCIGVHVKKSVRIVCCNALMPVTKAGGNLGKGVTVSLRRSSTSEAGSCSNREGHGCKKEGVIIAIPSSPLQGFHGWRPKIETRRVGLVCDVRVHPSMQGVELPQIPPNAWQEFRVLRGFA